MKNKIILPIVAIVIVVVLALFFVLNNLPNQPMREQTLEEMEEKSSMVEEGDSMTKEYSGEVIAGSTAQYLRYNEADFEKAISEGKVVYVYFYATWCPICVQERPNVLAAFDELAESNLDVVGFEAHWRDGQDNAADQELARDYGVSSQHTHLFIDRNGNVVEKTLAGLDKEEIKSKLAEIAGAE